MTWPTVLFGFVVAILMGSGFHLWRGGNLIRLAQYLVASILGFWMGQLLAFLFQWDFIPVGALQFGTDVTGSLLFLFMAYWLTRENPANQR